MCTRCTPFGIFASCTVGTMKESTVIRLEEKEFLQRHGRLDMDYVCSLYEKLMKDKEICDQLCYFPNQTLYKVNDSWRYIEYSNQEAGGRSYQIMEAEKTEYLDMVLEKARAGCTPMELATIISANDVTQEEALNFIYDLINSQLLYSELQPNVTGDEFFYRLMQKLKTLKDTERYLEEFNRVGSNDSPIRTGTNPGFIESYKNKFEYANQIGLQVRQSSLIQVDSYRPAQACTLNDKINNEVLRGLSLLQLLSKASPDTDLFAAFKIAFASRYEGQWMPLVEVLDTECGIGYARFSKGATEESPLLAGLQFGKPVFENSQKVKTDDFKWALYEKALSENKNEVVIEDKVIETLAQKMISPDHLPGSFCTMIKIISSSADEIDKGNYKLLLHSPTGPSGANLLARFCHLHPQVKDLVDSIIREEERQHPEWIFAEIAHLPEARTGNILMRPGLREFEIPYLCGSSVSEEFQIPVTDLLVTVAGNEVILCSKRLNKRILPRLTSAHNFNQTTLPIYQFLCSLQYQHIFPIGWNWDVLRDRPFLPRVSYDRFIVSKARWIISQSEVDGCELEDDETLLLRFAQLKQARGLPDLVHLSEGDNELLLHLGNIHCLRLLLAELRKGESVTLTESFDDSTSCWINSGEGQHTGEFIFAFDKKTVEPERKLFPPHQTGELVQRSFPPGSEWLYAKIYCGTKTAESVLINYIKPLTEELLKKHVIDKFFFVRYHDTANHLRVRFHNAEAKHFWIQVMDCLQLRLHGKVKADCIYDLQYDTYNREIERYGVDTIEQSEDLFYHQSVAVLDCLSLMDGDEDEQCRWQIALKAIDLFLDDLHYSIKEKFALIKEVDRNFADEFKLQRTERNAISEKYRKNKLLIEAVMEDNPLRATHLTPFISAFRVRLESYTKSISAILCHTKDNPVFLGTLLGSFLHMLVNRFFMSNQRKMELVLYEFLYKYYQSKLMQQDRTAISILPLTNSA
jgi:lantibiotic biosynthesis protein